MKLPGLKSLRFFAALTIVLFHLAHLGKVQIPDYLWFVKTHFAVGVPLFYVVSAYSLMIGYHGKLGAAGGLSEYFIRRITRIAPLFYFMIIAYTATFSFIAGPAYKVSFGEFMASVFFIFNLVPQYANGFVWASWSIGVEMVFYAVFPIIVLTVTSTRRAFILFLVSLYLTVMWHYGFRGAPADIKPFSSHFILAYISYFATGILGYFIWQHLRDHARSGLIGVALLTAGSVGAVLVIGYSSVLVQWTGGAPITLYLWPPVLAAFTIGISLAPVRIIVSAPPVALGDASFSLYLWHPPVIILLRSFGTYSWVYETVPNEGVAFVASAFVTFAVLFPLSLASYRWIEKPGNRLALNRILASRGAPS